MGSKKPVRIDGRAQVLTAFSSPRRSTAASGAGGFLQWIPTAAVWASAGLVGGFFVWFVGDIFMQGLDRLSWSFLFSTPQNAGRAGGIGPIIVSTLLILSVCMGTSLVLGLGAAVFLTEVAPEGSGFGRFVRRSLDVLAGVPSIVFGLFGNAFFCKTLGLGFSILSGGLTLACMVLPILIRSTEEGLSSVPRDYRFGAAALGFSRTTTLFSLLLPAAVPGLLVGLVLGVGRALAETAALLFTSGYVDRMPLSLMDSGRALSIHIYDLSMNVAGGNANAYATSVVLVLILLMVNLATTWISKHWMHKRILPL